MTLKASRGYWRLVDEIEARTIDDQKAQIRVETNPLTGLFEVWPHRFPPSAYTRKTVERLVEGGWLEAVCWDGDARAIVYKLLI